MKNISTLILCFLIISTTVSAQLRPGEIGYNPAIEKVYADMGIQKINIFQTNPEYGNEEFLYSISLVDENGRITEEKFPSLDNYFSTEDEGYGDDTSHYFYEYTADNRIKHITSLDYDLNTVETYFVYNEKGKLIEKTEGGAEARRYTFEYDDKGNITKAKGQTPVYTSGENSAPIDIQKWNDVDLYTYKYNDNNQLIETQFIYGNDFFYKILYTYENARISGFKMYSDEKSKTPDTINTLTYNSNGTLDNMVVVSNLNNTRITYRCAYDSK